MTLVRIILVAVLLITSYGSLQANTGEKAKVFYLPHIHSAFGGRDYETRGGDLVFFSYIFIALEVMNNARKYEVYSEGFLYNLNKRSRYRISYRDLSKIKRGFSSGFPTHINFWTQEQKELLLEYGPVTILYVLNHISIIRKTEMWRSHSVTAQHLRKCAKSQFFQSVHDAYRSNFYRTWGHFYRDVRLRQKGASQKRCYKILRDREVYLVRKIKRRQKQTRKDILIIFGYAHDFGKYFNDKISYLGGPELTYAALCYYHQRKRTNRNIMFLCNRNFKGWVRSLGMSDYFTQDTNVIMTRMRNFGHTFKRDARNPLGNETIKRAIPENITGGEGAELPKRKPVRRNGYRTPGMDRVPGIDFDSIDQQINRRRRYQ